MGGLMRKDVVYKDVVQAVEGGVVKKDGIYVDESLWSILGR